jgi:capsule polysaccharide export protein KpsE/RkpR
MYSTWRNRAAEEQAHRDRVLAAVQHDRLSRQAKAFDSWRGNARQNIDDRLQKVSSEMTAEIVAKYEAQMAQQSIELAQAKASANRDKARVVQLEEDLRRALLRGMTVMNMECLDIFSRSQNQGKPFEPAQTQEQFMMA